jgi:hypothetical protein
MAMKRKVKAISNQDLVQRKTYKTGSPGAIGIDKEDDKSK